MTSMTYIYICSGGTYKLYHTKDRVCLQLLAKAIELLTAVFQLYSGREQVQ